MSDIKRPAIKITDRDSLTRATLQAELSIPPTEKSWAAEPKRRAELVSQPGWEEITRLRIALTELALAPDKMTKAEMRLVAQRALALRK